MTLRQMIPLRLSPEERALLQGIADAWGESLAVAARRLIREYAAKHKVAPVYKDGGEE